MKGAVLTDCAIVKRISEITISEVYPHYYPDGAVRYFLEHHSEADIISDIKLHRVFLCLDLEQNIVGTVTIKANEICRLFVLPEHQGKGYGTEMLDYAENAISYKYSEVMLAASLPAKRLYLKRGYIDTEFHIIPAGSDDFLCYDVMERKIKALP